VCKTTIYRSRVFGKRTQSSPFRAVTSTDRRLITQMADQGVPL